MKGQGGGEEQETVWIFFTRVATFVLVAAVLLYFIEQVSAGFAATNMQATAEILQLTMNSACQGQDIADFEINIPQPSPKLRVAGLELFQNTLPRGILAVSGDPDYLLYFEAFQPGEGISWELFHDFDSRAVVYAEKSGNEMRQLELKSAASHAAARVMQDPDKAGSVLFANVILKDKEPGGFNLAGDIGRWEEGERGTAFYRFNDYEVQSPLNKTAVKYRPCGKSALCLKSKRGVLRLPLDKCAEQGINYVQLEARQKFFKKTLMGLKGIAVLTIDRFFKTFPRRARQKLEMLGATFGIHEAVNALAATSRTDFYLASPCRAKLRIEKTRCECWDDLPLDIDEENSARVQLWQLEGSGDDYRAKKLPDESFRCRHRMNLTSATMPEEKENVDCLLVKVVESSGFCFSKMTGEELGPANFPLYQSASILLPGNIIRLEPSSKFPPPRTIIETDFGEVGYAWP